MKNVLVIVVCVLEAISASTTINDVRNRKLQVEDFLNQHISEIQLKIAQRISTEHYNLNYRVNVIKKEIEKSPQKCHVWLKRIDSIASKLNKQFDTCDRFTKLREKNASEFKAFDKKVLEAYAFCQMNPSKCQVEIDKLDRTLSLIQSNMISDITSIEHGSNSCLEERRINSIKTIQSAYVSFQKCK